MFVEGLGGGLPVEGFLGSTVECCGDSVQVASGVSAEVGAFGEVLAEETVGVLVGSTLPWCLGVAEVDIEIGVYSELGVLCYDLGTDELAAPPLGPRPWDPQRSPGS